MLRLFVHLQVAWLLHRPAWLTHRGDDDNRHGPQDRERGQASAEYALVLLGAAAIALLVVAWPPRPTRSVNYSTSSSTASAVTRGRERAVSSWLHPQLGQREQQTEPRASCSRAGAGPAHHRPSANGGCPGGFNWPRSGPSGARCPGSSPPGCGRPLTYRSSGRSRGQLSARSPPSLGAGQWPWGSRHSCEGRGSV
jgi:hypothetical protein